LLSIGLVHMPEVVRTHAIQPWCLSDSIRRKADFCNENFPNPNPSIHRELVVNNDLGVALAVAGDELRKLGRCAAFGQSALGDELLLHIRHGQYLLQVFGDFFDDVFGRVGGGEQAYP
jgi:hypothetical protein